MSSARMSSAAPSSSGARSSLAASYLADEAEVLAELVPRARSTAEDQRRTEDLARRLVEAVRSAKDNHGGIDAFLAEYGLSTEEGVILMCLAEALLRIPDAETADALIDDKIPSGDWAKHLGQSGSLFVNASTWGLMLTGRVIGLKDAAGMGPVALMKRLVARSGEPVIRQAMRQSMRIMGDQFVLGSTIGRALTRAWPEEEKGYRYSYDMLGEGARTSADAQKYLDQYIAALEAVGNAAASPVASGMEGLMARPGLSVKLSAIHPRFEPSQRARVATELVPRLTALAELAKKRGLSLTVDAEEAERLDLTLEVFAAVRQQRSLDGWHGLGLAVQAYSKRALPALRWLKDLALNSGHRLPVRLVKGAYWDTEIKIAQERGLDGYPVFTRKANTDVSYLACARMLIAEPAAFYPQFATHNAHTVAAIHTMAGKAEYEFQRLHGMGESLYAEVVGKSKLNRPCRVYAPVGEHEDLLAYLVRRLLENGANTSFVNRLADAELPVDDIIQDPVEKAERSMVKAHPGLPLPKDVFGPARRNSAGAMLWDATVRTPLLNEMLDSLKQPIAVGPIIAGQARLDRAAPPVLSPHDRTHAIGTCRVATAADVEEAFKVAYSAQRAWDRRGGPERAAILERAADLFESKRAAFLAAMVREAGKTIPNALADLREAVDFLRYYAVEARRLFAEPVPLRGATGERNVHSLHGRGVFVCIAPWNFPVAIFTGQVAAALAAGNTVLAKPAEQTPITAAIAVGLLHEAGVPPEALHLLTGGGAVGAMLTADRRTDGIAFTGSNATALAIQAALAKRGGPIVPLIAETGGINAMIVDSSALPEQVVRDALASAFDSAGQRCSALRVMFLQEDIASRTLDMLIGATEELRIGDPMDYATDIGPVIDEDAETMLKVHKAAMTKQGKLLLDMPLPSDCRRGTYVTPAIFEIAKMSVLEKEVFGPILHVVRYSRGHLAEVCAAIEATGYGLTLGLHSRIESVAEFVAERVRVGNFYVNRNQIGAVVGSQPFGGAGLSGTGPKAGGPFTLPRFAEERVRSTDVTAAGGNTTLLSLDPGA